MAVVYRNTRNIVENTKQKDLLSIMNGHGAEQVVMRTAAHHRMIMEDTADMEDMEDTADMAARPHHQEDTDNQCGG
jgi:hypothetical protein